MLIGIAEAVSNDPLMTLKILVHAASHQGRRVVTDAETVTEALVMMGISPFFRAFGPQTTVEAWLQHEEPAVLDAVRRTMNRAHRGANLALAFAVQRMDPEAATVHAVALMHEFADLLLWCHAPALQLQIAAMQHADPELRSSAAQEQVLNIGISDLQVELARRWHLPALLAPSEGRPSHRRCEGADHSIGGAVGASPSRRVGERGGQRRHRRDRGTSQRVGCGGPAVVPGDLERRRRRNDGISRRAASSFIAPDFGQYRIHHPRMKGHVHVGKAVHLTIVGTRQGRRGRGKDDVVAVAVVADKERRPGPEPRVSSARPASCCPFAFASRSAPR